MSVLEGKKYKNIFNDHEVVVSSIRNSDVFVCGKAVNYLKGEEFKKRDFMKPLDVFQQTYKLVEDPKQSMF